MAAVAPPPGGRAGSTKPEDIAAVGVVSNSGDHGIKKDGALKRDIAAVDDLGDEDRWIDEIPECPVFRPTKEQFADPLRYIYSISEKGKRAGIAKVIPPEGWNPDFAVTTEKLAFPTRIQNIASLQRNKGGAKYRKRRNKSKKPVDLDTIPSVETVMCEVCEGGTHEAVMLLCDSCGKGFHIFCLTPPLASVPEGDWQCNKCMRGGEEFGFDDGKKYTFQQFERLATMLKQAYFEGRPLSSISCKEVETEFWRVVESRSREVEVLYGSDLDTSVVGSGFPSPGQPAAYKNGVDYANSPWNLNNFARLAGSLLNEIADEITGVTVPWLYVGMMFSAFCWHNEDHHMYSINYNHFGAPKTWYGVPGDKAQAFEDALRTTSPELFEAHPDLLYQLTLMVSPRLLINKGVPVFRTHQGPGEFILTFPAAYHGGFSQGVNCAEAVNFATPDWLGYGYEAIQRYKMFRRLPIFSHEELLILCVQQSRDRLWPEMLPYVYKELKRIRDVEKSLRARLRNAQKSGMKVVRCTKYNDSNQLVDDLKDRHCSICNHLVYLSGITCQCSKTKIVCLNHANQLCTCEASHRRLHVRYTLHELLQLIDMVETLVNNDQKQQLLTRQGGAEEVKKIVLLPRGAEVDGEPAGNSTGALRARGGNAPSKGEASAIEGVMKASQHLSVAPGEEVQVEAGATKVEADDEMATSSASAPGSTAGLNGTNTTTVATSAVNSSELGGNEHGDIGHVVIGEDGIPLMGDEFTCISTEEMAALRVWHEKAKAMRMADERKSK